MDTEAQTVEARGGGDRPREVIDPHVNGHEPEGLDGFQIALEVDDIWPSRRRCRSGPPRPPVRGGCRDSVVDYSQRHTN